MNAAFLVRICATVLIGSGQAIAEQNAKSTDASDNNSSPESIACAQERGEALGQCSYRIKHGANGKTTVTVIFANGFKRGLIFEEGKFIKASVTMSGVGTNAAWSEKDGMHFIAVDGQRYEVPNTLTSGD